MMQLTTRSAYNIFSLLGFGAGLDSLPLLHIALRATIERAPRPKICLENMAKELFYHVNEYGLIVKFSASVMCAPVESLSLDITSMRWWVMGWDTQAQGQDHMIWFDLGDVNNGVSVCCVLILKMISFDSVYRIPCVPWIGLRSAVDLGSDLFQFTVYRCGHNKTPDMNAFGIRLTHSRCSDNLFLITLITFWLKLWPKQ